MDYKKGIAHVSNLTSMNRIVILGGLDHTLYIYANTFHSDSLIMYIHTHETIHTGTKVMYIHTHETIHAGTKVNQTIHTMLNNAY